MMDNYVREYAAAADGLVPRAGQALRTSGQSRRAAYVAKTRTEIATLAARGVVVCGNAFSSVLIVKGELSAAELAGGPLLAGPDGDALRKALVRLGYAPEDWAGLSALVMGVHTDRADAKRAPAKADATDTGSAGAKPRAGFVAEDAAQADGLASPMEQKPLTPGLFRTAVAALGPSTVLLCDEVAATAFCTAYGIEPLTPGVVTDVLGMRALHLGGFAASLDDPRRKQWAWACLKQVPPLAEPY